MFDSLSIFDWILFILFASCTLIQLLYYWLIFARLAFYKVPELPYNEIVGVSVVIAARNEYHNLIKNLPLILEKDYPEFEVVVVNHASNDETADYLKEISQRDARVKVVHIQKDLNFFSGKKFPLSLGIKSAQYDILLLTDADCQPVSKQWITKMARNYTDGIEVVLGFGPYIQRKGLLNLLINYDTFMVAMQYLSYALMGSPYMGVGRNLSYRKTLFYKNKGFISHYHVASGDDDLFINQVANRNNTRIEIAPETHMVSEPKYSFTDWIRQKSRHLSTGKIYQFKHQFLLGVFSLSQLFFFVTFILLLVFKTLLWVTLGLFILRFISLAIVNKKITTQLQRPQLLIFSLIGEVFYVVFIGLLSIKGIFRKQGKWK